MKKTINSLEDLESAVGFEKLNKLLTEYSMLAIGKIMEDGISSVMDLAKDKYGNNIAFPSSIMSDMTTKGLLGKWTSAILSGTVNALHKYYIKDGNIDAGDKSFVVSLFRDIEDKISNLTPVLEDLVDKNIYGIEDIFIAVYGITSDEVYVLREFMKLSKNMASWDEDYMWNDCITDKRLRSVLLGED